MHSFNFNSLLIVASREQLALKLILFVRTGLLLKREASEDCMYIPHPGVCLPSCCYRLDAALWQCPFEQYGSAHLYVNEHGKSYRCTSFCTSMRMQCTSHDDTGNVSLSLSRSPLWACPPMQWHHHLMAS